MPHAEPPISELVADLRARRGLTQEGLARALGVSFSTVNAWEAGRSEPQQRHRRRLERLAAGRDVDDDGRISVLCVDDSALDLEVLTELVRDAGAALGLDVDIIAETDALRAAIMLGRLQPRVAFVDVLMPGLDGFELADRIAEMTDLAVELVLVTASPDAAIGRTARERGLAVLGKPLSIGDVRAVLRAVAGPAAAHHHAD